jgi:hypothetical protein
MMMIAVVGTAMRSPMNPIKNEKTSKDRIRRTG